MTSWRVDLSAMKHEEHPGFSIMVVRTPFGALAALWADGDHVTALPNPLIADSQGVFQKFIRVWV